MRLAQASTYFLNDYVDGWNGTSWDLRVTKAAVMPFDRFISDQEWTGQGKSILLDPNDTSLENYSVIRLESGQIFMLGFRNFDSQKGTYSQVYSIMNAGNLAEIFSFTKATSASGMAKSVTRTLIGSYRCNVDHLTFMASKQFENTRLDEDIILLPRDAVIDTGHEIRIDGNFYYDVLEVYQFSGMIRCRAMKKRSA